MNSRILITRCAIIVIAILIWELATRIGAIPRIMLTPPSEVLNTLVRSLLDPNSLILTPRPSLDLYYNLRITTVEISVAYFVVSTLGLLAGFAIGQVKLLEETFEPLIVALFAIPYVTLYPLILLLLGFGLASKMTFGVVLGLFPVVSNTVAGLRQIDKSLVISAISMGAKGFHLYSKVIIPASAPAIVAGLKQGMSLTVLGVVAAELISSPTGIGYLLNYEIQLFRTSEAIALVLIVIAISMIGLESLQFIQSRMHRQG